MVSYRTRTVLWLMAGRLARTLGIVLACLAIVVITLGIFSVNLVSFQVITSTWNVWHTPGATMEPLLRRWLWITLAHGILAQVIFWPMLWRNSTIYPAPKGPLMDHWILAWPNPDLRRQNTTWRRLVVNLPVIALYMANLLWLLMAFVVWMAGVLIVEAGRWLIVRGRALKGAWQRSRAQMAQTTPVQRAPFGTTLRLLRRHLTESWDQRSQRLLDQHPEARVKVEQNTLREVLADAPTDQRRPRGRL